MPEGLSEAGRGPEILLRAAEPPPGEDAPRRPHCDARRVASRPWVTTVTRFRARGCYHSALSCGKNLCAPFDTAGGRSLPRSDAEGRGLIFVKTGIPP
jgi:hypothetical protein